ncbi:MAG: 4Fe-4S binding protein [Candidatus Stygibacter australis]|nr:4Fe-4S binding protein [Candidatus Stygibacter australis]MDP8321970.1 4Fe-4S binding protein [Candidatus Stygibacter australis]
MKREIIYIDENKCNGCGNCIPGCPEGALQIIDGKARLVSDLFCDGLGACIGDCPLGAISVTTREAEAYDEAIVLENIIKAGPNTIKAHLKHLRDHDQKEYFEQALAILLRKGMPIPKINEDTCPSGGCPSTQTQTIDRIPPKVVEKTVAQPELQTWPVQLHLLNASAPYLENADLLIAATCVPFAYPDFHAKFIKGRVPIVLCPKLDKDIDQYIEKLAMIFQTHKINSVTIARMEVPCCGGTEFIIQKALEKAQKFMMVKVNVISIKGEII